MPTPIIRQRAEHNISRRDIDPDALKVLYRLVRSGYTAYLVGGGVRDLLLGRKPKDFDVSTNATPKELRKLFSNCFLIGRRFRLAHLRYGDKIIETSTFRATPQHQGDDLLQTDDNVFGTPEEDALRRDFTVNGLFYDIDTFSVIDYVGGLEDLGKKVIRSIGDPLVRFREDPVRMLRAIRFAARLHFTIDPETLSAISVCKEEIRKTSRPRLLEEVYRLFMFGAGETSMRLLLQTGMLEELLPSVARYFCDFAASGRPVEDAPLWRHLHEADARGLTEPEQFLAALYFPLIIEKLGMEPMMMSQRDLQKGFDEVVWPFLDRYGAPRHTRDLARLLVTTQHRFYLQNRRHGKFSKVKFMTQGWFAPAFLQFQINYAVHGGPESLLERWQQLVAEFSADAARAENGFSGQTPGGTPDNGDAPRRKRRRRKPRRRHHSAENPAPTTGGAPDAGGFSADAGAPAENPEQRANDEEGRGPTYAFDE